MTGLADNFPFTGNGFPAYVGTTAPQNAMLGQIWFNPTSGATQVYTNTGWETVNASVDVQVINLNTPGGAGIGQAYINWFVVPGNVITGSLIYGLYGSPPLTYVLDNMANPSADASWIALNGSTSDTQLVALQPNAGGIGAAWAALPTPPSTPGMVTIASFQTDLYILVAEASPSLNASWSRLTGVFQAPGSGAANRILTADATGALSWLSSFSGQVNIVTTQPASPVLGTLYYDQTRTPAAVEVWNGTAWVAVDEPPKVGATAPTGPVTGSFWYDTSLTPNVMKVWNGTAWVLVAPAAGSNGQLQFNNAGAFAGAAGVTTTGTEIAIASGTKTASAPAIDVTQTWNAGGVAFSGARVNVTDTASAAGSKLLDIQKAGVSQFNIDKTGQAMFGDGTAAAPAITNIGDENTGILFPAADTVAVATGGTERVRVDASGNFGIGTGSPSYRFHAVNTSGTIGAFRGTTAANSSLIVGNTAGDLLISTLASGDSFVYADTSKYIAFGSNSTERLRILSNGDIGIGQTAVTAVFGRTVSVTGPGGATLRTTGSTVSAYLYSSDGFGVSGLVSETNHPLVLSTNSVERVRIDTSGAVGIGVTPAGTSRAIYLAGANTGNYSALSMGASGGGYGTVGYNIAYTNSSGVYNYFSSDAASAVWFFGGGVQFLTAAAGTAGTAIPFSERMRITTSGDVGIGTNSPSGKLHVSGGSQYITSGDLWIATSSRKIGWDVSGVFYNWIESDGVAGNSFMRFAVSNAEAIRITTPGNVGIGTSSPGSKLHVATGIAGVIAEFGEGVSGAGVTIQNRIAALPTTGTRANIGWIDSSAGFAAGSLLVQSRPAVGAVVLSASGAGDMVVLPSGNVGIGTSSPTAKLEVSGSANSDFAAAIFRNTNAGASAVTSIRLGNDVTAGAAYLGVSSNVHATAPNALRLSNLISGATSVLVFANNGDTERMRISSAGNVGIGTASPSTRLHVSGSDTELRVQSDTATSGFIRFINTTGSMSVGMSGGPTNTLLTYDRTNSQTAHEYLGGASGYHAWMTVGAERMRLDNSGNVGIGVVAPLAKLHVATAGNNYIVSHNTTGSTSALLLGAESNKTNIYSWTTVGGSTGVPLAFTVGASESMRITAAGNVGIGTTAPSAKLSVSDAAEAKINLMIGAVERAFISYNESSSVMRLDSDSVVAFNSNNTERMRIDAFGNVGISVTPSAWGTEFSALQLGYSGAISSYKAGTNAEYMHVLSNAYNDNANWRYVRDGAATRYEQHESVHKWFTSASGLTGNVITFTQAMTLADNGNLGIGTTSPSVRLTVNGSAEGTSLLVTSGTDDNNIMLGAANSFGSNNNAQNKWSIRWRGRISGSGHSLAFYDELNAAERMRIDSAGNVGIGTSSPGARLSVSGGSVYLQSSGTYSEPAVIAGVLAFDSSNGDLNISARSNGGNTFMRFYTSSAGVGTERMRITSAGDLVIGSASALLSTAGRGNITLNGTSGSILAMGVGGATNGYLYHAGTQMELVNTTATPLTFSTSNLERMRITAAGNVVIGETQDLFKFAAHASNPTRGIVAQIRNSAGTSLNGAQLLITQATIEDWVIGQPAGVSAFAFWTGRNSAADGTERMRLDAAGNLGINVTPANAYAPGKVIQITSGGTTIYGSSTTASYAQNVNYDASGNSLYATTGTALSYSQASGAHRWYTAPSGTAGTAVSFTQTMMLDTSGNLGIGVTPSAWGSNYKAIQANPNSALVLASANINAVNIASNAYNNNTNWLYTTTGAAACFVVANGAHQWFNTASGTAGTAISFTQAMMLDNSGNLGVGVTPGSWVTTSKAIQLGGRTSLSSNSASNTYFGNNVVETASGWNYIATAGASLYAIESGNVFKWYQAASGTAGTAASFTQAMTLDASGNLGIGTTTPSVRLTVSGRTSILNSADVSTVLYVRGASYGVRIGSSATVANIEAVDNSGGSVSFQPLYVGGSNVTLHTGGVERVRLDASGNIGVGTSDQFGSGAKVIGIANASTVPTTNPTGGGVLYVEGGALKYRGSSGTVTTIAPA